VEIVLSALSSGDRRPIFFFFFEVLGLIKVLGRNAFQGVADEQEEFPIVGHERW
jgi:hypothetical protein